MTPMQRSIAQARAREQRLDAMLGPPPTPPAVPKVWGASPQTSHTGTRRRGGVLRSQTSSAACCWKCEAQRHHSDVRQCVAHCGCAGWQGIYLHGSVGSGKTMVMDLACAVMRDLALVPKLRRVHFSRAFDELHQRMHRCASAAHMHSSLGNIFRFLIRKFMSFRGKGFGLRSFCL